MRANPVSSVTVPPRLANAICGPVLFVLYIVKYSLNKSWKVEVSYFKYLTFSRSATTMITTSNHTHGQVTNSKKL